MTNKASEPTEPQPVQRTLTETYHPDGVWVYEYSSETHTVRISAKADIDRDYTIALLRKLAGWLAQTPRPGPGGGDPWARSEPPF